MYYEVGRFYPLMTSEKKFRRGDELSLSWFGDAKFRSVGVLTGDTSAVYRCDDPPLFRAEREEGNS